MMTWYSKSIGDKLAALAPTNHAQELFWAAYAAAGSPADMAIFSQHDEITDTVTLYFSPKSASLAKALGATLCQKPARAGLSLLCGAQRCFEILF